MIREPLNILMNNITINKLKKREKNLAQNLFDENQRFKWKFSMNTSTATVQIDSEKEKKSNRCLYFSVIVLFFVK